ncbi:uncharacterized protein LOC125827652 [Solanum verrucosum]|uniref:uncharacterized protein LOC125827652 n=1 Tax=Solanum verrucosum TaxID=315347 RepID=UPI0020D10733|nr:uncharacterized protein LOC125827652 [Solanum verrucosum]
MNPPKLLGSKVGEDPQNFIDKVKKILGVMQVTQTESVELESYQLKDVGHICCTQWKDNRGADAAPVTWDCFTGAFLDSFFPRELIKAKAKEFMNLKQGSMSVQEYGLKFTQLSRFRQDHKGRASGSRSQWSALGKSTYPTCPKCGKNHLGECLAGKEGCFGYDQSVHRLKDFPSSRQGKGGNNNRWGQRQNRLYALQASQD